MSPVWTSTRERRERARRRALKREMVEFAETLQRQARLGLEELDHIRRQPAREAAVVLEGRVEGSTIVLEAEAEPGPKA